MPKLIKVTVLWDGRNTFTLNYEKGVRVFNGTKKAFAKFLQKVKASDNQTEPKSLRQIKYKDMVDEVVNGTDSTIWIWKHNLINKAPGMVHNESVGGIMSVYLEKLASEVDKPISFLNPFWEESKKAISIELGKPVLDFVHEDYVKVKELTLKSSGIVEKKPVTASMLLRSGLSVESFIEAQVSGSFGIDKAVTPPAAKKDKEDEEEEEKPKTPKVVDVQKVKEEYSILQKEGVSFKLAISNLCKDFGITEEECSAIIEPLLAYRVPLVTTD